MQTNTTYLPSQSCAELHQSVQCCCGPESVACLVQSVRSVSRCATAVALKWPLIWRFWSLSPNQLTGGKNTILSVKHVVISLLSLRISKTSTSHEDLSRLAAVLQISILTLSALRTLTPSPIELLPETLCPCSILTRSSTLFFCLFFHSVCSKASKEAGQALVAKAPSPPFESQHNHLLHCLEKTTVRYPFLLKHK